MKSELSWYADRCIFLHDKNTYEERTVLFRACSFEEALDFAAVDAKRYEDDLTDVRWIGTMQCFHLFDPSIDSGTEVFSLLRDSKLSPNKYVKRFFPMLPRYVALQSW